MSVNGFCGYLGDNASNFQARNSKDRFEGTGMNVPVRISEIRTNG